MNIAYNADCLAAMREMPDNAFDLAVVDPPYGIGYDKAIENQGGTRFGNAKTAKRDYHVTGWDKEIPTAEYFTQLFRVSKNCIIWGGITSPIFCRRQRVSFVGISALTTL